MRRLAWATLTHDRLKFAGSIAGIAVASTLTFVQLGLFSGFRAACSAVVAYAGGDVWVMRAGTPVFDGAGVLHDGVRAIVASDPCVREVRAVVLAHVNAQTKSSAPLGAFVVGVEQGQGPMRVPWQTLEGLPTDLREPLRVSIDEVDLARFDLPDHPLNMPISVGGLIGRVAVVTEGLKSFTLAPLMFSHVDNVRAMINLTSGQSNFWVAELRDLACAPSLIKRVRQQPNLDARLTRDFIAQSENYWMGSSGAGPILEFGMMLSLAIAGAVVAQALYALTRDHLKELAALRALGASSFELARFVLWQAGLLGACGASLGLAFALLIAHVANARGTSVILSHSELLRGALSLLVICFAASALAVRAVLKIPATAVFE
jgi:putative ABC transport system permease protein